MTIPAPAPQVGPDEQIGPDPLLLRVEEAAHLLAISRSKTYELIAAGQLPSLTIGKARRVPLAALNEWITSATVVKKPESGRDR